MRILITNDDGIEANGIHILAKELSKRHEVYVYAPKDEKSGVGHSFTFLDPLYIIPREDSSHYRSYAITGTPVDCVKLGMSHMMTEQGIEADFVVSGINRGANLGTDVLYSGTVAGAMEGILLNKPALAVSCTGDHEPMNYETGAIVASKVLEYMIENPLPDFTMFNLNVADMPLKEVKGIRLATLGIRNYCNSYVKCMNPRGKEYYWLNDEPNPILDEASDIELHAQGYATITPISPNMTNHPYLEELKQQSFDTIWK